MWLFVLFVVIIAIFAIEILVLQRMSHHRKHGEIEKLFIPHRTENPGDYFFEFGDFKKRWYVVQAKEVLLLNQKKVVVQSRPFCDDHETLQIREVTLIRRSPDGKHALVTRIAEPLMVTIGEENDILFELEFHSKPRVKLLKIAVTNDYAVNDVVYVGSTLSWGTHLTD